MPIDLEHRLVARPGAHSLRSELLSLAALLVAGIMTASLCLLAQFVRHGGIALGYVIGRIVLKVARRYRVARFDFGLEKLARLSEMFLGLVLIAGSLALLTVATDLSDDFSRDEPATIAIAAAANVGWVLWTWRAERGRGWARAVGLASVAALTLAALSGDRAITVACDLFAGVGLLALATWHGARIFVDALREVVDSPADAGALDSTLECLFAAGIAREELRALRSRQVGNSLYLELKLAPSDEEPLASLHRRIAEARRAAAALPHWLDLSITVAPA